MLHSYKVRTDLIPTTEEDKRALAERIFQRPRTLLELPLILVPEHLVHVPEDVCREKAVAIAALNEWMTRAKAEDLRLLIERPWIPTAEIYIPNTPIGKRFFNTAKAIGEIPTQDVIPKNLNQGYWLLTLRYFWQAKGVIFAYKLKKAIPNPVETEGILSRYLPDTTLKNLELTTNIDLACFKLLVKGEPYIRKWAAAKGIDYPFKSPMQLFLEIQKQSFLMSWKAGPGNSDLDWPSKAQQRDDISVRIRLLEEKPWLASAAMRQPYPEREQAYLKFLLRVGWYGYWLLALRKHSYSEQISDLWQAYIDALKAGKELFISEFDWRAGQPYKTKATSCVQPVEGFIGLLSYINWCWS